MANKERAGNPAPTVDGTKVHKNPESTKDLQENPLGDLKKKLDSDSDDAAQAAASIQPVWKKYLHDFGNKDIARPDFLLRIGGEDAMPRHELTTITGKAGQGKSYFNLIILGALLKGEPVLDIIPLRWAERILYVDTEQSEFDIAVRTNAVFRAMGWEEFTPISFERLRFLRLRTADSNAERAAVTEAAIEDFVPDVIFLDGLTDFVTDLDDKNEAHDIVAKYLKLIDESECNVIATIHQNEGSENGKLRELVGSEVTRKSRTIIDVSVKDGFFTAKPRKGKPFTYNWRIDPFGNLTTILAPSQLADEQERKQLHDLFTKVIAKRSKYDSKKQIYSAIGSISGSSSDSRNEETFLRAESKDIVRLVSDGHKYILSLVTGNNGGDKNCE